MVSKLLSLPTAPVFHGGEPSPRPVQRGWGGLHEPAVRTAVYYDDVLTTREDVFTEEVRAV